MKSASPEEDEDTRVIVLRVQDAAAARRLLTAMVATASVMATDRTLSTAEDLTALADGLRRSSDLAGDLAAQFDQLVGLLETRTLIEQAKGMLMAAGRITAEEAFQMLKSQSQHDNIKLRDVAARHVVLVSADLWT